MATKKSASKSAAKSTVRKRDPHSTAASSAVDAQLERYRSMRDFSTTEEPSGAGANTNTFAMRKPSTSRGLPFVIQKHAASHLHYDFRLSWGGVLKSWAIAKGPSYNPQERRLAIEVEDHPLEYGGFEGIIPQGQYGGGTVMIWDQGSWWPQLGSENVDACLRGGHLKFEMNGSKMKGKWALIRMNHAAHGPKDKPQWLLIKEHDKYERGPGDPAITDERPNSSVTGRSIDQIAHAQDHVWNSNRSDPLQSAAAPKSVAKSATKKSASASAKKPSPPPTPSIDLRDLPRERQPDFISPQLAFEAESTPDTDDWIHELKLDGYRIQARKSGNQVQLLTRKGIDWTHRMPDIAKGVANLPVRECTLDGEVVVLSTDGNSSFALLQASFQNAETHPLTYFVFDLLHIDGHDTRDLSLRERKQLLAPLLPPDDETIRFSEDIPGNGETVFRKACALHAEGIISKRADAPYRSTRSSDWLKSKCLHEQELVIAGFTLSSEGPDRVGALLLGYYPPVKRGPKTPRHLIYAGRTGTGFTQKARRDLLTQLVKLRVPESAFQRIPHDATRDVFWVRPTLVAQVRFATWTSDNLVRQAAFLGLREDKSATEVVRESATVAPKPKRSNAKQSKAAHAATKPNKPRTQAAHRPKTLQHFALTPTKSPRSKTPNPMPPKSAPAKQTPTKSVTAKSIPAKTTPKKSTPPRPTLAVREGPALTHPDKILDPTSGLTKQLLADYYAIAAERMLPYIANRPLSLVRCPQGSGKPCFFQKHVNNYLPPGIKTIDIQDKTSSAPEPYITLDTAEALVSLAQMNVLEIHPWGSTNDDLEHPDRLIFDLDPDAELPWLTVAAAAAEVRQRLKNLGIESFLKLTGGKGLHIVAPIQPTLTWTELKTASHNFVLSMERQNPDLYLTKMTKSSRVGRIFLDYLRNQRGATAVAPYSPRARAGATISLPLPWTALTRDVHPVLSVYDVAAHHTRLRADPWKAFLTTHQQLHPKQFAAL
ncbi:non-homologous end-joining DNA ligase [Granulicella sp. L46]|uniref:non-homologous end-joining DNA ligase n=1 Tax=Granulicella sp. L46 TaxID=1641865 RepID=UPI00131B9A0A|nr:non-homologous end-joining DNA ligase [Granulicella sp. L46]